MEPYNFETEVLAKSNEIPVLVDFWSPSCGPCRVLGPVLDKLASQADGKWELIKINTMDHQQVAMDLDIQSIPHVKLFSKGKLVSEFVGSLPEPTLAKWLEEFIPTPAKEALNEIRDRLSAGDEHALTDLRAFVSTHPDMGMARLILASETVMDTPLEALALVEPIKPGNLLFDASENVRVLAEVLTFETDATEGAPIKIAAAREALEVRDFDQALSLTIEGIELDKTFQKELPRRATVSMLRLLGPQHPLTMKYRRKFEMALFR
jgi:putative thioredoxin